MLQCLTRATVTCDTSPLARLLTLRMVFLLSVINHIEEHFSGASLTLVFVPKVKSEKSRWHDLQAQQLASTRDL